MSAQYMEDPFCTSLRFSTLNYRGLHLEMHLRILSLLQEFHKKLDVFHRIIWSSCFPRSRFTSENQSYFFLQEFHKKLDVFHRIIWSSCFLCSRVTSENQFYFFDVNIE